MKEEFDRNGYVCVRGLLDNRELEQMNEAIEDLKSNDFEQIPDNLIFFEEKGDKSSLKQIQKLQNYSSYFESLANSEKVMGLAEACLGGKAVLQNIQYFNKVPGKNQPTPPHQDGFYFMIKPQQAVTMWLSLDYADESNGAVRYVKGSHLAPMRPHQTTATLGFSQGIADWSEVDVKSETQMTAKPGDILVHHSMTIHSAFCQYK